MIVNVLTIAPLDMAYSYNAPDDTPLGAYVCVPFGKREIWGVVWAYGSDEGKTLKDIIEVAECPPMNDETRQFIDKVSGYNIVPKGLILKTAITGANKFKKLKRATPKPYDKHYKLDGGPELTEEQLKAVHEIHAVFDNPRPILLDGITGSGKTEVYLEAVTATMARGQSVLIMVPEIALTTAVIDRLTSRFGAKPAIWHSQMTPAQRRNIWNAVARGEELLVIGARSALFLPWADLGLIVVDEEHDQAYKQEDMPIYNARDMAVLRAHIGDIPIILASATPSLETMSNIWNKRYKHVELKNRFGVAKPPSLHVIDMRKDRRDKGNFIGTTLKEAIDQSLGSKEQSLLYLNRRGYAPLTLCRACGEKITCPHCEAWLVEHRQSNTLKCHHCDYTVKQPETYPSCEASDSLVPCGPGVERIAEEVKELWPDAKVEVLTSDTSTDLSHLHNTLQRMQAKDIDILIGTQMIAKGHHFPNLTCVGVVDADLGLSGGDLRAGERTYQLLTQVAGRAGREEKSGHVWLQSYKPEARVMQALLSNDRDQFLEIEASEREMAQMPPYTRLIALIIKSKNQSHAQTIARQLYQIAPDIKGLNVWGPAQAPLAKIRDQWRFRFLLCAEKTLHIQPIIKTWVDAIKTPNGTTITIDMDPQNFL